jgi:transposase-like protein
MPRRKCYTNREKLHFLEQIDERQTEGETLRSCCRHFGLQPSQVRRWRRVKEDLSRPGVANKASLHSGRASVILDLGENLLRWFFELREQGIIVSVRLFTLRACELCPAFRMKTARAKDMSIRRFLASNRIVLRAVTHECQRPPEYLRREALDFIEYARPKLVGPTRDPRFILNMDQTPIFFDMSSGRTLSNAGERTVNGRTSSSSTLRVTVSVTVTASGMLLKPLIVFKGKPGARIETREFPTYPQDNFYACQDRAWMDERVMLLWVRLVLQPYIEEAPPGVQPLILLDSYRCHMMASVVNAINNLGVQIETIPGGCTGLCQPIDVGIGKPLKSRARHLWEEWMMDNGVNNAVLRPPTRLLLSLWITESAERIRNSPSMVQNSWRHGTYTYFPNEPAQQQEELPTAAAQEDDDDA